MNNIQVQGSGFPATNKTWRFLIDMINELHSSKTAITGDLAIISGCEESGGNVSDGIITINGEQLKFIGAAVGSTVIIVENIEQVAYIEDINPADGIGDSKDTYFTRYATFGTGATEYNWSDFVRISSILELQKAMVPVGVINMWSGAINAIPQGWKLCDGANGTPDLRGKFIVAYDATTVDYNAIGKTGGAKEVSLTENQMPSHNHDGSTDFSGSHTHTVANMPAATGATKPFDSNAGEIAKGTVNTDSAGNHSHSFLTGNKGGNQPHENRPPYFTLAYIMFVGN